MQYVALRKDFWGTHLSNECKDLLTKILCPKAEDRLSLDGMLKHPFLQKAIRFNCN